MGCTCCICASCLLHKGWVQNRQDLWIISRLLAGGGVGEWKSWCLVISSGWMEGHAVLRRRGKVCWNLEEKTDEWHQPAVILGEQESWRKPFEEKRKLGFLWWEDLHWQQLRRFSDLSVLGLHEVPVEKAWREQLKAHSFLPCSTLPKTWTPSRERTFTCVISSFTFPPQGKWRKQKRKVLRGEKWCLVQK